MSRDQVLKYLELQEQGYRATREVAEQLGYKGKEPQRKLRQDLRRNGYESVGNGYYTKKDSCEHNSGHNSADISKSNTVRTNSNTSVSTTGHTAESNTKSISKCAENSVSNGDDKISRDNSGHKCDDKSNTLNDETLKKLLTLADNFDNIMSNTSSNTFGDAFKITPCKSPTAQTIKVDHDVWQKFRKFAKASDYKQQDLLTTALELLMEHMSQ